MRFRYNYLYNLYEANPKHQNIEVIPYIKNAENSSTVVLKSVLRKNSQENLLLQAVESTV